MIPAMSLVRTAAAQRSTRSRMSSDSRVTRSSLSRSVPKPVRSHSAVAFGLNAVPIDKPLDPQIVIHERPRPGSLRALLAIRLATTRSSASRMLGGPPSMPSRSSLRSKPVWTIVRSVHPPRSSKVTVTVVSMLRPSSTMNMVDWKTIRHGRSTSVKTFLSR
jgi:hypothetical protein